MREELGVDISPQALANCGAKNAWKLHCADSVEFQQGNWLEDFEEGGSVRPGDLQSALYSWRSD